MKKTAVFVLFFQCFILSAQSEYDKMTMEISDKVKKNYVDAEMYKKVDSLMTSEIQSKEFKNLNEKDFAAALTQKLRLVTGDEHFFVKYLPNYIPKNEVNGKEDQKQNNEHNSLENFGFESVKRLEGNIGYINFKGFAEAKSSSKTLESVMNFVANTNSLIIDLRENGGDDNEMLVLFCSYFFDKKTDLYTTYFRNTGKTEQNSTYLKVSGQKYLNKNIYVLTRKQSFSAAEAAAFFLQEHKLAKVIGETTGGAANPVEPFVIQNKFLLLIPAGKITSSLSHKNWNHVGVRPDIEVQPENALKTAHSLALKEILKNGTKTELSMAEIKNLINKLEQ